MSVPTYLRLGTALCESFGIDPSNVKRLNLDVSHEGVFLTVEMVVVANEPVVHVQHVLSEFELVPKRGAEEGAVNGEG